MNRYIILVTVVLTLIILENITADICTDFANMRSCQVLMPGKKRFRFIFKVPCNKNLVCYKCGKKFGLNKFTCDRTAYDSMNKICRERNEGIKKAIKCSHAAKLFFIAIRSNPNIGFSNNVNENCTEEVKKCF